MFYTSFGLSTTSHESGPISCNGGIEKERRRYENLLLWKLSMTLEENPIP